MLGRQHKADDSLKVLRIMEGKGIKPINSTYNRLIINFGKKGDLEMVQKMYEEMIEKYGIKPVLGVIPENKDNTLLSYPKKNDFWKKVRIWNKNNIKNYVDTWSLNIFTR